MADRDFYEILGLTKGASTDEIRNAYRDLARRYHPDVSKEADAQARFTEIREAYDVLSDEQKRRLYDRVGRAGVQGGGWGVATGSSATGAEFDVEDLGSMFDAFFAGRDGPHGARVQAHRPRQRTGPRASQPIERTLMVSFITMARGGTQTLEIDRDGQSKTISVTIPKGIAQGAKLRLAGVGPGGRTVLVTVRVGGHPHFTRTDPRGLDLAFDLLVTFGESALGATVTVPTLDGAVDLRVPPGTTSGRKLRLKGKGLQNERNERGDLYAIVKIVPPEEASLTDQERDALRRLDADRAGPRQGSAWEPGWTP